MHGQSQRKGRATRVSSPEQAFGHVLRVARTKQSVSQEALAFKGGYHRTYIGQLERGEKSPSLRTIFALAGSLDISPSKMILEVERLLLEGRDLAKR
jgi:transcriptional regulator with XRE-family HTH domain